VPATPFVGKSRSITSSDEPDVITSQGDITPRHQAQRVVDEDRFGPFSGRMRQSLINTRWPLHQQAVTIHGGDFAAVSAVNLALLP